eukprot:TRINITY_DN29350_c0_g1_i1.p1 TRINITY_DN29350_c0_g1~~TRINITY_DN29350_c0_g1_i1.p1  ORF type:complete len:142 (+),score=23.10 TRINITY_DN29350_c0_g1_i1:1-426(+)
MQSGYEYLDHPADVIVHGFGGTVSASFEQAVLAMFNYMAPLQGIQALHRNEVHVDGHDLDSLLYNLMDEFFMMYATEYFICSKVVITDIDMTNFTISAYGEGEKFDPKRHEQGTEIKAITMHNMHIEEVDGVCHAYVTVDI